MSDSTPAIAGVESCGCITYVNARPDDLGKDDRKTIAEIVETGGSIRRATVDEIKADPNFFPRECPHEPKGWGPRERFGPPKVPPGQLSIGAA